MGTILAICQIVAALGLLNVWLLRSSLVLPAALLLTVLMLGALAMHVKVHDPFKKSLPAVGMLALALIIVWASLGN